MTQGGINQHRNMRVVIPPPSQPHLCTNPPLPSTHFEGLGQPYRYLFISFHFMIRVLFFTPSGGRGGGGSKGRSDPIFFWCAGTFYDVISFPRYCLLAKPLYPSCAIAPCSLAKMEEWLGSPFVLHSTDPYALSSPLCKEQWICFSLLLFSHNNIYIFWKVVWGLNIHFSSPLLWAASRMRLISFCTCF